MSRMVTNKMIEVLTMLERKTSAMEKRVDKIEMRMAELTKRKKWRESKRGESSRESQDTKHSGVR